MKPVLSFLAVLALSAHADFQQVCLGRIPLAGIPPSHLPPPGRPLHLTAANTVQDNVHPLGALPAWAHPAIARMRGRGLSIRLQAAHHHPEPRPGRYLSVSIWVDTPDPDLVEPLTLALPIHSEEELHGHE